MAWDVVLLDEVTDWFLRLDQQTRSLATGAIDLPAEHGPTLGRPAVDAIRGSRHNMKELRPGSVGATEVRILFVFDSERRAVLLVAGDKSGQWEHLVPAEHPACR